MLVRLLIAVWYFIFSLPAVIINAQNISTEAAPGSQKVKDFYLSNYKENGLQDWELRGKEAVVGGQHVDIETMNATYYTTNDTISVSSQKAVLDKESMNVDLQTDVHVENRQGVTLDTDSLAWKRDENKIQTDDWVKTGNDNIAVTAQGMDADTQLKKVNFKKNVESTIVDKKTGEPVTITCTGPLEVDYNRGKAIFNDNVVVDNIQAKMLCDKATAYFDGKNKRIIKIISEGHVKIMKDENITFAEKATYLAAEDRLVFEGRPKVIYFPENGVDMPEF